MTKKTTLLGIPVAFVAACCFAIALASGNNTAYSSGSQSTLVDTGFVATSTASRIFILMRRTSQSADSDTLTVRAFDPTTGNISEVAPLPDHSVSAGAPQAITQVLGQPCVGYTIDGPATRVACLNEQNGWEFAVDRTPAGSYLADLQEAGGRLYLLRRQLGGRQAVTVERATPTGFQRVGHTMYWKNTLGMFSKGRTGTDKPEVSVVAGAGRKANRYVLSLQHDSWKRRTPKLRRSFGSLLSGSIIRDGITVIPSVTSVPASKPWRFEVWESRKSQSSWKRIGTGPLNRGNGDAQGGLAVTPSGQVWAQWNERGIGRKSMNDVAAYVAKLDIQKRRVTKLYRISSNKVGLSRVELVGFHDSMYVIYQQLVDNRPRTFIRRLSPAKGSPIAIH